MGVSDEGKTVAKGGSLALALICLFITSTQPSMLHRVKH